MCTWIVCHVIYGSSQILMGLFGASYIAVMIISI